MKDDVFPCSLNKVRSFFFANGWGEPKSGPEAKRGGRGGTLTPKIKSECGFVQMHETKRQESYIGPPQKHTCVLVSFSQNHDTAVCFIT